MTEQFSIKEGHTVGYDVEFLSTTNEKFKYFEGTLGRLEYRKGVGAFFDTLKKYLYTSVVTEVDLEETEDSVVITLTTLNSVYKFKVSNT